jgi:hypothetical protein
LIKHLDDVIDVGVDGGRVIARGSNAPSSGGFGVLGFTDDYYRLGASAQTQLRSEILATAKDRNFVRGLFGSDKAARRQFFDLIREAEVVGTHRAGGAAGLLKVKGEAGYRLRFALTESDSFLGIARPNIIKHELGHFAREANRLTHGRGAWLLETTSLFEQERRSLMYIYNVGIVMPREEFLVEWMIRRLK